MFILINSRHHNNLMYMEILLWHSLNELFGALKSTRTAKQIKTRNMEKTKRLLYTTGNNSYQLSTETKGDR